MTKTTNLINKENIDKCIEYSDNKEKLKALIDDLKVSITLLEYGQYFDDDKDFRNIYNVKISRNTEKIFFKFGDSIHNTQEGNIPDLYSILATCASEYMYNGQDSFNEFCEEYGYDQDSRKALKTFKNLEKMNIKLHKIFNESDIEVLPR